VIAEGPGSAGTYPAADLVVVPVERVVAYLSTQAQHSVLLAEQIEAALGAVRTKKA
jgi:hypothetical protein